MKGWRERPALMRYTDVVGGMPVMHQSRKEQSIERTASALMNPDLREVRIAAELGTDMEAAEEWEGKPVHTGRSGNRR